MKIMERHIGKVRPGKWAELETVEKSTIPSRNRGAFLPNGAIAPCMGVTLVMSTLLNASGME